MISQKTGDWKGLKKTLKKMSKKEIQHKKILNIAGAGLASSMKKGLKHNELNLPPLKSSTIEQKGSSIPLVDTATMANSITSKVILRKRTVFVGVLRGSPHPGVSGGSVNLAYIHVNGATIQRGNRIYTIPKRDFITPSVLRFAPVLKRLYEKYIKNYILKGF